MSKRQRTSTASAAPPPVQEGAAAAGAPAAAAPTARQKKGARKPVEGASDPTGVTFSLADKAAIVSFSRDRRTATCSKGYRMVRTTTAVTSGAWYFEFTVSPDAKPTAHFRLGVSTELGESHGPVGYSHHSYAYRDAGGSRVHQSIRSPYGRAYGPGDVVGVLLDFATPQAELAAAEARDGGASAGPADGARQARAAAAAAAGAEKEAIEAILHCSEPPQAPGGGEGGAASASSSSSSSGSSGASSSASSSASSDLPLPPGSGAATKHTVTRRWWGSSLRFFVNGEDQGIAFVHLTRDARLLPAASMYCGGSVRLNPGPVFAFPPAAARFPCANGPPEGGAAAPAAVAGAAGAAGAAPSGEMGAAAESSSSAAAAAEPVRPCCSPWRPFSETEEPPQLGAGGLHSTPLSPGGGAGDSGAGSSTLLGTGLLRVGAYNFANTEFAFEGGSGGGGGGGGGGGAGRSRKRR